MYIKCNMFCLQSQFNFASIIIQPLDHNINRVVVKIKDELKDLAVVGNDAKVVSDQNVAILARQLALHANVIMCLFVIIKISNEYFF